MCSIRFILYENTVSITSSHCSSVQSMAHALTMKQDASGEEMS